MRKPLSFSLVSLIAFSAVLGVILLSSIIGSWHKAPQLPEIPQTSEELANLENPDYSKIKVTTDNVQSVVRELKRPSAYYVETKSELYFDNTSATYLRRKWVRDHLSHVNIFGSSGNVTMNVIFDDNFAYYWYPNGSRYTKLPRGRFSANDAQMMMDYTDILNAPKSSIVDAKLSQFNGELCVYVEIKLPEEGFVEKYWVSTQSGLLLLGQTLKSGNVVYSIQTIELDLNVPEDSVFTLPNNVFVGNITN